MAVKYRLARMVLPTLISGVALLCVFAGVPEARAQDQFYTQSGGRGLQNAKTNARLTKIETDVVTLNTEMAKVKPHAKADLGSCPDAGDKLRYTGTNWVCERETDPTVQGFAKKSLPTCTGGSILGVQGGEFACVQGGFLSNETDPTVQTFAKSPLPSCGNNQLLSVSGGNLTCVNDQTGLTRETDPMVHDFARVDTAPNVPNCSPSEMLTMTGGRLSCKVDSVGITQEADPLVADFARKDIAGYSLAACSTGELLRAVTENGKVILKCEAGGTALAEVIALNDLVDVDTAAQTSGTVLMYDGTQWTARNELDPTVPAWAKTPISACAAGQVLTIAADGTLQCINDAGGSADPLTFAGLDDVDVTGITDGKFVKYDLTAQKWKPATVEEFAQTALPTCATGEVLSGDGTNLTCVNDAGGSADPLDLVELGDVRTSANANLVPNDNDFLRWDTASGKWVAVHDKLSATQTASAWCYFDGTDVKCDRGAPQQCGNGQMMSWNATTSAFGCVSATGVLGLGTMAFQDSNNVDITGGVLNEVVIGGTAPASATFTTARLGSGFVTNDLHIGGSLYVSGSQSIDGVSFANGGLVATGAVSATSFSGDGRNLTNLSLSAITAPGATGDVLFKGVDGTISASTALNWEQSANNLKVTGSVQMAGTGAETCDAAGVGKTRIIDTGSGDVRMQFCRQ